MGWIEDQIARAPEQRPLGSLGGAGRLERLLAACTAGNERHSPAVTTAIAHVAAVIGEALEGGVELERLQTALNWWSDAHVGPRITISDRPHPGLLQD